MRNRFLLAVFVCLAFGLCIAAPRAHLVGFGPWFKVRLFVGPEADRMQETRVRSLNVDGRLREFTIGAPHDITDRIFVIRRAFRMNDALSSRPEWKWQRDGWVMVERSSGRISKVNLPDFDPFYSVVSWFRDYAAYCGIGEGQKLYALVTQLGQRKPVLRTYIGPAREAADPDSECTAPVWQKQPVRVTFEPSPGQKLSYAVRGRFSEPESAEEPLESKEAEKQ